MYLQNPTVFIKEEEKKDLTFYVEKIFFNINELKEKNKFFLIEDEYKILKTNFELCDEFVHREKVPNLLNKTLSLLGEKNVNILRCLLKSPVLTFDIYNLLKQTPYKKIFLFKYLHFFKKNYLNEIENSNNLFDTIYFKERNIVLKECRCTIVLNKNEITNNKNYSCVLIFKDIYKNYFKVTKNFSKLFRIIYCCSLTFEDDDELYNILPIYFLRDIFGIILSDVDKNFCYYSFLYKCLLNITNLNSREWFRTISFDEPYIRLIKNFKLYEIRGILNQFYKEEKEEALLEIIGEDIKKYYQTYKPFGYIYNSKKEKINIDHFFNEQLDYVVSIGENNVGENNIDTSIVFYNFKKNKLTHTKISFLKVSENMTINYIDDEGCLVPISKFNFNKYFENFFIDLKIKEEEVNKKINLCFDSLNVYKETLKKFFSDNINFNDEELEFLNNIPCLKKEEDYFLYKDCNIFEDKGDIKDFFKKK